MSATRTLLFHFEKTDDSWNRTQDLDSECVVWNELELAEVQNR